MYKDVIRGIYDSGKSMERNMHFMLARMKKDFEINSYLHLKFDMKGQLLRAKQSTEAAKLISS